jgi:NADP-dependent 3-hydroxy acid dehydrogenase YdfG
MDIDLTGQVVAVTGASSAKRFAGVTPLEAQDIANAIHYAIAQPANVSANEVLVRPSGQSA